MASLPERPPSDISSRPERLPTIPKRELAPCRYCGSPIPDERWVRSGFRAVLCSNDCGRKEQRDRFKVLNKRYKMSTGNVGALSELVVCADLLKRGFEVFRSVSQSTSCDLAILKEGKLVRVEVTTGSRTSGGKVSYPAKERSRFDVLAIVVDNEVIYQPKWKSDGTKEEWNLAGDS